MHVLPYKDLPSQLFDDGAMKKVTMQIAVGPEHAAPNFVMRVFTIEPGGHTTRHSHAHEHEVFFHSGKGNVFYDGETREVGAGHVAFIAPYADHQIRNTGDEDLIFVCVVPILKTTL